jgi:hypothetical protein
MCKLCGLSLTQISVRRDNALDWESIKVPSMPLFRSASSKVSLLANRDLCRQSPSPLRDYSDQDGLFVTENDG